MRIGPRIEMDEVLVWFCPIDNVLAGSIGIQGSMAWLPVGIRYVSLNKLVANHERERERYLLVNSHITMERSTIFNWKINPLNGHFQ